MTTARPWSVAMFVLALGCSAQDEKTPPSADSAAMPDPTGRWTIVAHQIPGVSAMSDADAATWHGRVIDITAKRAISNGDTCAGIAFGHETRPTARFLGEGYHIAPFTLGIEDTTIGVTWISCAGINWAAPGGVLIWAHADSVFTPWDGVFFQMVRGEGP